MVMLYLSCVYNLWDSILNITPFQGDFLSLYLLLVFTVISYHKKLNTKKYQCCRICFVEFIVSG